MPDPKTPPRVEEPQAAYDPVAAGARATRQLEQSGFNRQQADAVVLAVRELAGDLATKEDLAVTKSELKVEMAGLKTDLKTEMANLRAEFKTDLAHSETRMGQNALRNTLWTVGILLAAIGVATAILLAALKP
ncbi:MAG: hypothetical protein OXU94_03865 [Gammaproteobacteria bacterium]|nr:hypothetical protein [Gammaproteobacteria bacterium]